MWSLVAYRIITTLFCWEERRAALIMNLTSISNNHQSCHYRQLINNPECKKHWCKNILDITWGRVSTPAPIPPSYLSGFLLVKIFPVCVWQALHKQAQSRIPAAIGSGSRVTLTGGKVLTRDKGINEYESKTREKRVVSVNLKRHSCANDPE